MRQADAMRPNDRQRLVSTSGGSGRQPLPRLARLGAVNADAGRLGCRARWNTIEGVPVVRIREIPAPYTSREPPEDFAVMCTIQTSL